MPLPFFIAIQMKEILKTLESRNYVDSSPSNPTVGGHDAIIEKELDAVIKELQKPSDAIQRLGINVITGLTGDKSLPIMSEFIHAGIIGENVQATPISVGFNNNTLSPKRMIITVEVSKQLDIQNPAVVNTIQKKMREAVWKKLEDEIFSKGAGSLSMDGIFTTVAPITAVDGPTLASQEGILNEGEGSGKYQILVGNEAFVSMKTSVDKADVSYIPEMYYEDKPVVQSAFAHSKGVCIGDFRGIDIAFWNNIEIKKVTSYDLARKGQYALEMTVYVDANWDDNHFIVSELPTA